MINANQEPRTARADRISSSPAKDRRDILWFLVAFGFLAAGLAGGTIMFAWRPEWMWPFPAAGFIGYVLAFRHGLLLWNPNIDRTWREYFWRDRDASVFAGNLRVGPTARAEASRPGLRAVP